MAAAVFENNLNNIIEQKSLKWIFVGGKGGVGKTTTSSSVAALLAKHRTSVLIISTDPAHNLSDAFGQKFSNTPTAVTGFDNLFAMEVDAKAQPMNDGEIDSASQTIWTELMSSFPGIDEALSFAEIMKEVQSMRFEVIVFDTAPTGHTLRLLNLPNVLETAVSKFSKIKSKFSGLFDQFSNMMGAGNEEKVVEKLDQMKVIIESINKQFKNPELTTFICVCIPEFLSLYETERLVQELAKFEIDTHNIVVNQVLFVSKDCECKQCCARSKLQKKYIDQIFDLYEDFNVTLLPLLEDEVRGVKAVTSFSELLANPPTYSPK